MAHYGQYLGWNRPAIPLNLGFWDYKRKTRFREADLLLKVRQLCSGWSPLGLGDLWNANRKQLSRLWFNAHDPSDGF